MPRPGKDKAPAPIATTIATQKNSKKGEWTAAALEAKAIEKVAAQDNLRAAVEFAQNHKLGARKALTEAKKAGRTWATQDLVSVPQLDNALNGRTKWLTQRLDYDILTETEDKRLEEWLLASAKNDCAAKEQQHAGIKEVSAKVIQLLKARWAYNKTKNHSVKSGCVPLTKAEKRLAFELHAEVSHVWWQRWLARHPKVQVKGESNIEDNRSKKQNEHTVQKHFYGEFGIEAELLDANIMDPVTKKVIDPRRVLWTDETPQFIDYNATGAQPKAIGERGKRLRRSSKLNRETLSVCMTQDLSGFQYGPQLNIKRANFTEGMTDCFDTPEWAPCFNDSILVIDKKSTYLTMCKSDNGVQTGETLLEYLESLDKQITARSNAEVAMGRPPIERPVFLGTDNHNSRFDPKVLKAAADASPRLGMRIWAEESNVSHFLQWLDKINKMFHGAYNKAKVEYKKRWKAVYGEEPDIGIPEFLEIFGGCKEFDLEGMWFTWCTPQNIIAACRAVGFLGCTLDPSQIDRANFVEYVKRAEEEEATPPSPSLEEKVAQARGDKREGSVEALKAQLAVAMEEARKAKAAAFDPATIPGLLEPKAPEKKERKRNHSRIDVSEGGSFTLRQLKEKSEARQAEEKRLKAIADDRRDEAARKKQKREEEEAARQDQWMLCSGGCKCGLGDGCPMKGLKRCEQCGEIKKTECRKRACTEASAPLLLTHNGQA